MSGIAAAAMPAAAPTGATNAVSPDGVFLIHGLGGTQYDLGSMHKRLKNAGLVTHSLTLPGHGTKPEDLADVTSEQWIDAVIAKYREVRDLHPRLHLMGMCMGSLLAAVVAQREKHASGSLVLLAPPVYIDGWATPWYRVLRPLLYWVPGIGRTMKVEEEDPFGIKNEQLRAIVKAKFERGENFHYQWVPLECIRQVDRLRNLVMAKAKDIRCPTLVVHARQDELTSLASANFLVEQIGGARARMVVLEDSYHMVCVDNDREIVAKSVLEFLGAALPGATSALANDPRMTHDELRCAVEAVMARLAGGDVAGLRELAIPDLTWVQPGANAISGAHAGKKFGSFAARVTDAFALGFVAPGNAVFNRGVALAPATLVATTRWRETRIGGRAAVRVPRRQTARGALVCGRRRARGRIFRRARSGGGWAVAAGSGIRQGGGGLEDAEERARQRHAACALFAVQAGRFRRRDRRAPGRTRHDQSREIRRMGRTEGHVARRRDEGVRGTGFPADASSTAERSRGRSQDVGRTRSASRSRSTLRCTLPVVVIGSASRNSISFGYSYGARNFRT